MFKQLKTEYLGWIFLIGIILLISELVFFDGGLIYSLALATGCLYIGRKLSPRSMGKILYLIGIVSSVVIVLNMMIFKFFVFAVFGYILLVYFQSKKNPEWVKPYLIEPERKKEQIESEPLLKKEYLFENKLMGHQKTSDDVYEWNNINIQRGIGDTVIDLSHTILPKGEVVISIQSFVGNLQVLIPYDTEVRLHHSVIAGRASIFQKQETKVYNQILSYQTTEFETADQRIHLITSVVVGDIEVKRV
ncbi:cell wall-active antibiotics response protein LiaF [Peribacillus sp. JNUCC 23]|uniref:cell wall-active antibiotics response protein LiaF n=1 Tax=Peribacillus sp. NPDC096379 TaxID=3364393 RepID=UPI000785CC0C